MLTTQFLDPCLGNIECNYQQVTIVILGDTNRYKSETVCSRHGLKQVVSGSTRKASHLDSIFTNFGPMHVSPEHFPLLAPLTIRLSCWMLGNGPPILFNTSSAENTPLRFIRLLTLRQRLVPILPLGLSWTKLFHKRKFTLTNND